VQLSGKTVVISGGASGLGAATAHMVVEAGGSVAILDLNAAAGRSLATNLGASARFIETDVTSSEQVEHAFAGIRASLGGIHAAVCTAGIAVAERVLPRDGVQPLEHFARVVNINLLGTFNVVRMAATHLADNPPLESGERGIIVMTASVAAFDGQIGQAAYSASKGGIVAMTLPLAREFARMGVRVMTIAPGTFDTPLLAGLPDAARESLAQQVPFPSRLGQPAEYAALVRHICENQMLNGETIRLDGAIRMAPK
jgi:NAD(P)-dependent dehydrogenase (short-subunit alcohol dehydrogenase family)